MLAVPLLFAWGMIVIFGLIALLCVGILFLIAHKLGARITVTKNGKLVGHIVNFKYVPLKK